MSSKVKTLVQKEYFEDLVKTSLKTRKEREHYYFSLSGETSQFVRVNGSKVRQIGQVEDAQLDVTLMLEHASGELREATRSLTLTGLLWKDQEEVSAVISILRGEVAALPVNPFAKLPQNLGASLSESRGKLLEFEDALEKLLPPSVEGLDMVGIYAAGPSVRAMANSAGQFHWFSTETFSFDFSLYTKTQRALKSTYAGKDWSSEKYLQEIEQSRSRLSILSEPAKKMERGEYRTYLAPACLNELIHILEWGAFSESSIRQGSSCFRFLRSGERTLSPLFNMDEDFRSGLTPRFNEFGELAPESLPLIENGKLVNTMVSARSAKEFNLQSNGAFAQESPRSPVIRAGALSESQILERLGTGLYLSNLHYLGWSDQPAGRVTGMTRYACFWVENGRISSPIENMRWDDSVFSLLGTELEALTNTSEVHPSVASYESRSLGGTQTPGALLKKMTFTI